MSARDIDAPARQFQSLLYGLERRGRAVERRQRWPGATQFAESALTPMVVSTYGVTNWAPLLTLSLDPGAWLLMSYTRARSAPQVVGIDSRFGLRLDTHQAAERAGRDPTYVIPTANFYPLSVDAISSFDQATTVTMSGHISSTDPANIATPAMLDSFLIAYPL